MYKIIGNDGQEYGPVTADQIRAWIAAGRANAQSKVQLEGSTDWKPLSDFPEFAEAIHSKPPDTTSSTPSFGADAETLASRILAQGYVVDAGSCLTRAWDKLMPDLWPLIGVTALIWIALSASHGVYVGILLT